MKLTTQGIRQIDYEGCLGIRESKQKALILIKPTGEITAATGGRGLKDELIEQFNEEEDVLLLAWPGQWSQDIFTVTKDDLDKHYFSKL